MNIDDISENFNKEIENIKKEIETIKKNQSEMKNTITEIKNMLHGTNSRWDEAEDWIGDLIDKGAENTQMEQLKEHKIYKKEDSLRDLWDNIKCNNICIIGVPKREESKGLKTYLEK